MLKFQRLIKNDPVDVDEVNQVFFKQNNNYATNINFIC